MKPNTNNIMKGFKPCLEIYYKKNKKGVRFLHHQSAKFHQLEIVGILEVVKNNVLYTPPEDYTDTSSVKDRKKLNRK